MELMVSLNGVKVGTLLKDKSGGLHFSYTERWIKRAGARPISCRCLLQSKNTLAT